jgi:hypothetical protein
MKYELLNEVFKENNLPVQSHIIKINEISAPITNWGAFYASQATGQQEEQRKVFNTSRVKAEMQEKFKRKEERKQYEQRER